MWGNWRKITEDKRQGKDFDEREKGWCRPAERCCGIAGGHRHFHYFFDCFLNWEFGLGLGPSISTKSKAWGWQGHRMQLQLGQWPDDYIFRGKCDWMVGNLVLVSHHYKIASFAFCCFGQYCSTTFYPSSGLLLSIPLGTSVVHGVGDRVWWGLGKHI